MSTPQRSLEQTAFLCIEYEGGGLLVVIPQEPKIDPRAVEKALIGLHREGFRVTDMHHKRGKPKSGRAGCLLCKPHKRQGVNDDTRADLRSLEDLKMGVAESTGIPADLLESGSDLFKEA